MNENCSNLIKAEEVWLEDVDINCENEEDALEGVEELSADKWTEESTVDESENGKSTLPIGSLHVKPQNISSEKPTANDVTAALTDTCDTAAPEVPHKKKAFRKDSSSPFACYSCGFKSKFKKKLRVHVKCHRGKRFSCDQCDKKYRQAENLNRHLKRSHGRNGNQYVCEECDYRCRELCSLKIHMRTHTGEKPFACDLCDYRSTCQENLKRHKMIHTGERPFACVMCDFKSNQVGDLKRHERTHTGEKRFACSQCEYRSSRSDVLRKHMKQHTREKPYNCQACDYKCNRSDVLRNHMIRKHSEAKSKKLSEVDQRKMHVCTFCEFKSSQKANLIAHMRSHTEQKPYACDLCDYRSRQVFNLRSHIMTHTGEKPYSCSLCDYRSIQRSALKSHMRIHTGEKPYSCDLCDHSSRQLRELKKHKVKTHMRENQ